MEKIRDIMVRGTPIDVKVITRSSSNSIFLDNGVIKIKITEIPEDGKANKAIIELISKTFKIPKNSIQIIKGEKSHNKTIVIDYKQS